MTKTTGKRAIIYCRISLDATGEGLGVARQEQACREMCERNGWRVIDVITDNSVSATKGKRPGWQRVLDAIKSGSVDIVCAWQVDRLWRTISDLEGLITLSETSNVTFHTVSGDLNLATANGRMNARILGSVARQEVEIKAERQRAAHRQRASNGKPWWTSRAFGFEKVAKGEKPKHNAKEAKAIAQAYADVLNGQSLWSIAQRWSREGIRSPRGNAWTSSNLRSVLMNPRNAAIATYRKEETGQRASWEPIVSEDVYRAVVRLLSDPSRNLNGGGKRKGLLTHVAECSKCGGKVLQAQSRPNKAGVRYRVYVCRQGRCITIPADWLDSYVLRKVIDHAEEWTSALSDDSDETASEIVALQAEESALQESKRQLAEMFIDGHIDRAGLAAGTDKANRRLDEIKTHLAEVAVSRIGFDTADLEYLWQSVDDMDVDKLRSIVESVVESIVLLPRGKGVREPKQEHVRITMREPQRAKVPA